MVPSDLLTGYTALKIDARKEGMRKPEA